MNTKKFRINPHPAGVWSSSYKKSDGTSGYNKYALVYDTSDMLSTYMSLVENNTAALTDTASWMVMSNGAAWKKYVDSISADLIKEKLVVTLVFSGGSGYGSTSPTITVTDVDHNAVIESQTYNTQGSGNTFNISPDTQYTVGVSGVAGYSHPHVRTFTSLNNNERSLTMTYIAITAGIGIALTDGTFVATEDFDSTKMTANGIYFSDGSHAGVMSLKYAGSGAWQNPYNVLIPGTFSSEMDGQGNTALMKAYLDANPSASSPAYNLATQYVFPNGEKGGYLGANGEMSMLYINNTDAVRAALAKAGGDAISDSDVVWTSTQGGSTIAWSVRVSGLNGTYTSTKNGGYRVRPIQPF